MKKITTYLILAIMIFCTGKAFANIGNTYGFSAKGMALGNAMTAYSQDWDSTFYNMAGLGKTVDDLKDEDGNSFADQFAVNYNYYIPLMKVDIASKVWEENSAPGPTENLNGGFATIGLVLDLNHFIKMPEFISSARFGLGLGLNCYPKKVKNADGSTSFDFDMTMAKVNDLDQRTHQYLRYGRNIQHAIIELGIGFGFLEDMFGFGAGVTAFTDSSGSMLIRNPATGLGPASVQYPYQEVEMNFLGHVSPVAGFYINIDRILDSLKIYSPFNSLQIAASYRGEIYMDVSPFAAVTEIEMIGASLPMNATMFSFYTPHIVNGGISVDFWRMFVNVDCSYELWSIAKTSPGRASIWKDMKDVAALLGKSADELELYEVPKFKDVIIPKIGIGFHVLDNLDVMAGYYYQPTMLTDDSTKGFFNFMDNDKHVASLGVGYKLPKLGGMNSPLEINFSVQEQFLMKRSITKAAGSETKLENGVDAAVNKNINYSYSGYVTAVQIELVTRW